MTGKRNQRRAKLSPRLHTERVPEQRFFHSDSMLPEIKLLPHVSKKYLSLHSQEARSKDKREQDGAKKQLNQSSPRLVLAILSSPVAMEVRSLLGMEETLKDEPRHMKVELIACMLRIMSLPLVGMMERYACSKLTEVRCN